MTFDSFTMVLLVLRDDAPALDEREAEALQDAHMTHLAELKAAGTLLAAGPLRDERFRGLCLYRVGLEEARALAEADPAVQRGRFSITAIAWDVPAGVVVFPEGATLPRSTADVR